MISRLISTPRLAFVGFIICAAGLTYAAGLGPRGTLRAAIMLGASLVLAQGIVLMRPDWRRPVLVALGLWIAIWALHLGVRGFLDQRYGMQPNSVLVLQSVMNTTTSETREYLAQAWPLIAAAFALVLVSAASLTWLARRVVSVASSRAQSSPSPRMKLGTLAAGLAVVGGMHISAPNRRENPVVYWLDGYKAMRDWNRKFDSLIANRARQEARLPAWAPRYVGPPGKRTLILVLGESVNRWNWSLYGYPRATTPRLDALRAELLVFQDVISSAGNTIPEIERKLTVATREDETTWRGEPTVLMLARAAGYKIHWLSNQADRYINAVFARDADQFKSLNVGGHRGDKTLDGGLVPLLEQALTDPAEKKLIVIHMLGAHPHYELRYPNGFAKFSGVNDAVRQRLEAQGRFFWVRVNRDLYDNAMLYQDTVLADMIEAARRAAASNASETSLLYVSDHAQEVGHMANTVGHAFKLESGFTVPLMLWSSTPRPGDAAARRALEARAFQTDQLDWTLLPLLGIATAFDRPEFDLLGAGFKPFARYIDGKPYQPCVTCPDRVLEKK